MAIKRQTSIDKDAPEQLYTTPFVMGSNMPPTNQSPYEPRTPLPVRNYPPVVNKNVLEPPRGELAKDRRAMST